MWSGIGQENEILIAISLEGASDNGAYISSGNTAVDGKLGSLYLYLNNFNLGVSDLIYFDSQWLGTKL